MFQKSILTIGLGWVLSGLVATSTHAGVSTPDQELYEIGLKNIKTEHYGPLADVREVGGLKCILTHSDQKYSCKLNQENADHQAIFDALNVTETRSQKDPLNLGGGSISTKSAGDFNCRKTTYADPNRKTEYSCRFFRKGLRMLSDPRNSVNDLKQKPNDAPVPSDETVPSIPASGPPAKSGRL